jgi:L-aminopeptidase/D-esterase-like protein
MPHAGITDIPGVLVGQAQDERALTGCTAVLTPEGAACGFDVGGGAPGTRETDALAPGQIVERVHAVVLCGGSAFGLDAAGGVAAFLEESGRGFAVGPWKVPIVPAAVLFDLGIGDGRVRPDRAMGYAAAAAATDGPVREGNAGAGCGATVGKLGGIERAMKGGLGTFLLRGEGGVAVGALAVVNALGSVIDPQTGERLAGPRADDGSLLDDLALLARRAAPAVAGQNTTLAVVATNVRLDKVALTRVARIAHDGLARAVVPAHLTGDGDIVFALSTGSEAIAGLDYVGALAAVAVERAIVRGVKAARSAGGLPAHADLAPG